MFSSPYADKENVLGEVFGTTPNRRPLKTVQNGNIAAEGTPLTMTKRTPEARSTRASTPSSRRLARRLKRQSVPFALSKPLSVFQDDTKGIFGGNMGFEEGFQLKGNGQELNEMIRDKVSETVIKMKERYEATLAEKQRDLYEKNNIIEKLQSEMNVLKQSPNDFTETHKDEENQKTVSIFVEQIISKAIHEIENENSSENRMENDDFVSGEVNCVQSKSISPIKRKDSYTTMSPTTFISSNTSPMKVELTEKETSMSMTPIAKIHSATSVTPVQTADATLRTIPVCVKDAAISTSPQLHGTDSTTSPICLTDSVVSVKSIKLIAEHALCTSTKSEHEIEPITVSEIQKCGTAGQDENNALLATKTEGTTVGTSSVQTEHALCTPKKSDYEIKPNLSHGLENFLTPIQEEHGSQLFTIHKAEENTGDAIARNTMNTTIKESFVHVGTSMTPIEFVDKHTLVSPMQTSNVSVTTSPLVAALQPEIISSLPLNRLRAELESAAISNELLRSECDELNGKVESLQSSLAGARSEVDQKCCAMQYEMDNLQSKLDEVLEINYQMEMKKPFNVEEYDETIRRLQKDILLKEKQITFYTKKASEADNLQQDLRRMYAKYNTEHQLYTTMEQEAKGLSEKFNAKCVAYETLERELCGVKEALKEALHTVDAQEKVRGEAKDNQVKCYVLEEQIETFQSQQRENLEFLEQERKGLEETTLELEQLVETRTEELEVTRQALEEKTHHYEEMRETVHKLRNQLSDVQDELDAVQSQAYLVMLEQEKELTAVSRVLEETWERLVTVVQMYKEQFRVQKEPEVEQDSEEISTDPYKPSFVYSVLAAVSGTVPQADDVKESPSQEEVTETPDNAEVAPSEKQASGEKSRDLSDDFMLVSRAKAFQKLLSELESYVQDGNEHAQMIIQRQVDEIVNLEESLHEAKQHYEEQITNLKQERENEGCKMKKVQRENDNKKYEIESLKLELKTVEQNLEASRENMKELGNRCCTLIEQETENQVLNEKLRLINHELEKVKQDKACLEKELRETVERLERLVEASEGNDKEKQKTIIEETFTEILNKRLHLEKEIEKLRSSFAKALKENETFAQYNGRLEYKASILGSNLIRAEDEIYRLDGIVDRFCMATQSGWQTMTPSQDLRDLLKELNVDVE